FTVFFQAIDLGPSTLLAFTALAAFVDVAVYSLVDYRFTNITASAISYTFLINGFHGLDKRGWVLAVLMSIARPFIPPHFSDAVPEARLMAPVAAHCTSFGICWLIYRIAHLLHVHQDEFLAFIGMAAMPPIPVVTVREVKDTTITLYWQ